MKKLFMFLAVAGLATFGVSCSSDDSSPEQKELSLATKDGELTFQEGTSVTFEVTVDGKVESGAELYIGSDKITNPYKFDKEGEYKVVAKKKGFVNSNVLTITVLSENTVAPHLSLAADKTTVGEGESVTFTVTADGAAVSGTELYIGSDKITNPYKFDKEGEYKVVAKKSGYANSNLVTITVTEGNGQPSLLLAAVPATVNVGEVVNFTVKSGSDFVSGATITQVGGDAITGASWTPTAAGTFKFVASKDGYNNSNEVTVTVNEVTTPEGNFIQVGNNTYNLDGADLGVFTNSQNQAILYDATDGSFSYLIFRLYGNIENTEGEEFGALTMAVIMPEGATQIVWPQDAPQGDVLLMNSAVVVGGAVIAQTGADEEFSASLGWGAKAGNGNPGQVAFEVLAEEFTMAYDGEYSGLWAIPQTGGTIAKNSKVTKITKIAKAKTTLAK